MKHRIMPIVGYLSLGVIAIGITIFLYWLYSPPKEAISVSPSPIPIVKKTVKSDEFIVLKYTYCKNVNVNGRVVITLVGDKTQLTLPVTSERGDRECRSDVRVPLPVPPLASPGTYHFHFRATYKVNPLSTITQEYDTESFTVE